MFSATYLTTVAAALGPAAGWFLFTVMLLLRVFAPNQSLIAALRAHHDLRRAVRQDSIKATVEAQSTIEKLRSAKLPQEDFQLYKGRILSLAGLTEAGASTSRALDNAIRTESDHLSSIQQAAQINRDVLKLSVATTTAACISVALIRGILQGIAGVTSEAVVFNRQYQSNEPSYQWLEFYSLLPAVAVVFLVVRFFIPVSRPWIQLSLAYFIAYFIINASVNSSK